ncbi:PH domain-containing protein [Scleromatobacter humisilvae]|uniref:PH domain-containing protein n=1 Tax=Scleromatobacter humisilvae TaxID=2897159 RepID=A0A9X2C456_9BURK|nr:PH domain-containing protein [Scleromatobacter humisilvae]MCK9688700.1 PH domain-containing protein [Scleromatobacter humisilvae]
MTLQSNDPSTGETVLREARMSWWALWPRVFLGLIGLALAGWGLLRQDQAGYAVAGFGGLMFVWFVGSALLRRGAMLVKLTPRYLVLQTGLVSRHTSTVMLNRVESLDVDQSLWQRMSGYGTLTIRGTGSEDLRLVGINDPVGFQAEARRAINAASGAPL